MTSSLRARAAIGLAALLLAGLLAGCDEEDPADAAPSSDSPSAPTPSLPGEPTTLSTHPVELSPVMTVRAWVSAQNSSLRDGDTSRARDLSSPGCVTCNELLASIEDVYTGGGQLRGGRWTIDAARVTRRNRHSVSVTAGITAAAGTSIARSNGPEEHFAQQRFALRFELPREADHPVINRIVFLS